MMKRLLKSKMYLVGTLTMSIILFVSTGVQFWLTDYFINVLKFEREMVNIAYGIVSLTGPTSGCAYGNYFLTQVGILLTGEEDTSILPQSTLSLFLRRLGLVAQLCYPLLMGSTLLPYCYGLCYFLEAR